MQDAAEQIKSRYGQNIPARAQSRAKEYLRELKVAFLQCRDSMEPHEVAQAIADRGRRAIEVVD